MGVGLSQKTNEMTVWQMWAERQIWAESLEQTGRKNTYSLRTPHSLLVPSP